MTEIANGFLKRSDAVREEVSLPPGDANLRHTCDTVCDIFATQFATDAVRRRA